VTELGVREKRLGVGSLDGSLMTRAPNELTAEKMPSPASLLTAYTLA